MVCWTWVLKSDNLINNLFQKVVCRLLVIYIGMAVPVYVQARNTINVTPEHAAVEKQATVETVVKQIGQ